MANDIMLAFADGEYRFHLGMRQICELQDICKCGIGEIAARAVAGHYGEFGGNIMEAKFKVEDIAHTIRLGLIGGNMGIVDEKEIKVNPVVAKGLVDRYVMEQPLMDGWNLATAILLACIQGYEPPKKKAESPEAESPLNGGECLPSEP